jgi:DNA-directed RNA polymerase specialized sigma subunit
MTDLDEQERLVLTKVYGDPDLTPAEIAADLDVDEATVREVLDAEDEDTVLEAAEATDWDDPERCPFCGATLTDPGVGFVEHIEESETCNLGFEQWRENVAGDVGGEWSG